MMQPGIITFKEVPDEELSWFETVAKSQLKKDPCLNRKTSNVPVKSSDNIPGLGHHHGQNSLLDDHNGNDMW